MTSTGIDELIATFGVEPHDLQALDPAHPRFDAQRPLLVLPPQFAAARPLLARRYPETHEARAAVDGSAAPATVATLPADARGWLIAPLAPEADLRSLAGLRAVMERLYGPDGCPWDREQTHESLRTYLLEETYEAVDAIDRGDVDGLREELGDLLAHVFMHTSMAQERGEFSVEDVVEGIAAKMVRRHPHVFGDEDAGSNEQLLDRWDEIKAEERAAAGGGAQNPGLGALDSVPLAAPALQRSQSLQSRAARAGALEPELPALQAVARAIGALGVSGEERNIGRLLWAVVRYANAIDVDGEKALRAAAAEFTAGFGALERRAREAGAPIASLAPGERRSAWPAAGPGGSPTAQ